jgi:nitrogen fixation/metabolism regulation signal transduction histidine kinase
LALFAFVPAILITAGWGGATAWVLPLISGSAAWDSAAATGGRALKVARSSPRALSGDSVLDAHERELSNSVQHAHQLEYLARNSVPIIVIAGIAVLALLTVLASRAAGHLSRQLSRPLDELVGWTQRLRRGDALPPQSVAKGAPEFDVLRDGMREMAVSLEAGRRSALEAERLEAFRESARQVAHELKNPLTPIRFAVERLKRGVPAELAETVDVLSVESARLEAMARSFAQFGTLPEGAPSDIDLADLVQSAARTTVPPHVTCRFEIETGLPTLHGMHDALSRAIGNVLLNAVEACGAGGTITVRVAMEPPGELMVSIADSGPGIAPDRLEQVWKPYVTDKTGGTGLGLAIVKQTVVAHGGRVEARSDPGKGAEIRLIFPVRKIDSAEMK